MIHIILRYAEMLSRKPYPCFSSGDIVLITGKGHERSLCFGLKEYEWSDIAEIKKTDKEIILLYNNIWNLI